MLSLTQENKFLGGEISLSAYKILDTPDGKDVRCMTIIIIDKVGQSLPKKNTVMHRVRKSACKDCWSNKSTLLSFAESLDLALEEMSVRFDLFGRRQNRVFRTFTKLKRSVFGPYLLLKYSKKLQSQKNVATTTLIITWPLFVPTEVKTYY